MFSMLNPQPNGAGFVGFGNHDGWDLSRFSGIELRVRGQGDNLIYKVNFKHKGQGDGTVSYEAFYEVRKIDSQLYIHLDLSMLLMELFVKRWAKKKKKL